MTTPFLQAKYPLIGTGENKFLEISISQPEIDTHSPHSDFFCICKILAPNFEKSYKIFGIDPLQSVWLSLRVIKLQIIEIEKSTSLKCEYHFFHEFEK